MIGFAWKGGGDEGPGVLLVAAVARASRGELSGGS